MTPGLAFFYGGMVRSKNVLGMLMQNFFSMGLVSVLWVLVGFSLAFGPTGGGLLGDLSFAGLKRHRQRRLRLRGAPHHPGPGLLRLPDDVRHHHPGPDHGRHRRPHEVRRAGSRSSGPGCILVYSPVAHWVFSPGGWLFELGALDFAGGTVVHINAGIAALALVDRARQAQGLAQRGDATPRPAVHADRHRHPVVRLVRVQRRLGPGRQRHRGHRLHDHQHRGGGGHARLAGGREAEDAGTPPPWAGRRGRWPAWSPSPPAPGS